MTELSRRVGLPVLALVLVSAVLGVQIAYGGAVSSPSNPPTRAPPELSRRRPTASTVSPSGSCSSGSTAPPAASASAGRHSRWSSPSPAPCTDAEVDALHDGLLEAVQRMKADGTLPPASDLVDDALDNADLNGFPSRPRSARSRTLWSTQRWRPTTSSPARSTTSTAHAPGRPRRPGRAEPADRGRGHPGRGGRTRRARRGPPRQLRSAASSVLGRDRAVCRSRRRKRSNRARRLAGRLRREVARFRLGWRGALLWSLRITVAATASYVAATLIFPGTQPLLAPLTAMLVVQVTLVSLLASGLDRVVAVVTGVALATGFAIVVPLEWWSLGVLIFVSITIGQALRLRANLIEVAISAMLVLGSEPWAPRPPPVSGSRETLVGAAVGMAASLLFPADPHEGRAGREIEGWPTP